MFRFDTICVYGVGGQAVLGRQIPTATAWHTERHGYDPTCIKAEHSLSIGKINQNKLFYLISKGLSKKDALYLLVMGYFNN